MDLARAGPGRAFFRAAAFGAFPSEPWPPRRSVTLNPSYAPGVERLVREQEPQTHAGRDVLTLPVLLLNRHFAPVSVATVRRAFVLLYGGAARAVDGEGETYDFGDWLNMPVRHSDDGLPIIGGQVRAPRVLHLLRYDRAPRIVVRLTRKNLMLRDQFQCQYCGRRPHVRDLNVDHVLPRSRGGEDSWENLVVSCRACNLRKGRRTPTEAGMALLSVPHRPRWSTATQIRLVMREPFAEWQPFLETG
ncbi:MAG TPA: HNH endonuclease [Polyangiaceae bacterium]|nr:HNH endonuclease [Polyangiaceae bacterium]